MIEFIDLEKANKLHWYVQIKNRESGPYRFLEVLSMAYNKDLESLDLLTFRGLGGWHKLYEFENFKSHNINNYLEENELDFENEMPFRKSIRIPLSSEILIIVGGFCFKGQCLDLSTHGCLIKTLRGKIKHDNNLKIHFYKDAPSNLQPFNAKGESVRIISAEKLKEGSNYYDLIGIKFENLKKDNRERLRQTLKNIVINSSSEENIDKVLNRGKVLAA